MDMPAIKIGKKTIKAPRPTMKDWREIVAYDKEERENADTMHFLDVMDARVGIIQKFYHLTDEQVIQLDPADIYPAYVALAKAVIGIVTEKVEQIPNAETGEDQ